MPVPSRPLRIAILSWRDQRHPEAGGAEVFLDRVSEELARRGHSVTILTARYAGALPEEVLADGRRIVRAGGRMSVYPRVGLKLAGRRRSYDAVVDIQNGVPFWSPLVTASVVVCVVHHVHREQWQAVFGRTAASLGWTLESRVAPAVYRHCQYLTVSEATARDLAATGVPSDRIHVAYSGLDPQPILDEYDASAPPMMLVLGRLVPHKRVELALQALRDLQPTNPGLSLVIAGQGYHLEALRRTAAELGVTPSVRFAGRVSEWEKLQLLSSAAVHLLPSLKEGWGLSVVEAALQGTPTVAFRSAGGTTESILDGRTGLLADSPAQFVRAAGQILGDPDLRAELSKHAKEQAQHYSWSATTDALEELLAAGSRSRP